MYRNDFDSRSLYINTDQDNIQRPRNSKDLVWANNNIVYNNLYDNILNEQAFTNYIWLDGTFRNNYTFKNPFAFQIKFGAVSGPTVLNYQTNVNLANFNDPLSQYGNTSYETVSLYGDPSVNIYRSFKNVKFINIDIVYLPIANIIIKKLVNNTIRYELCDRFGLIRNRYLVMNLDDKYDHRMLSNNKGLKYSAFILYPDKRMGDAGMTWYPNRPGIVYPINNLYNLTMLDLSFQDDNGCPIIPMIFDAVPRCYYNDDFDPKLYEKELSENILDSYDAWEKIKCCSVPIDMFCELNRLQALYTEGCECCCRDDNENNKDPGINDCGKCKECNKCRVTCEQVASFRNVYNQMQVQFQLSIGVAEAQVNTMINY